MLCGGREDPAAVDGLQRVGVGSAGACLGVAARCMRTAALGVAGISDGIGGLTVREDCPCPLAEAELSAR